MDTKIRSVLNFEAPDGSAEPISSPRSLEACLRSGFDPKDLLPRSHASFEDSRQGFNSLRQAFLRKKGEEPTLTQMRYDHFEARRQWKLETVKNERARIIHFLETRDKDQHAGLDNVNASLNDLSYGNKSSAGAAAPDSTDGPRSIVKEEASRIKAGILEMERKRLIAIKKRQEKEMRRVLESEQKIADLHAKTLHAEEVDRQRMEEHEKEVQEQRQKAMEKKKQLELEKRKEEEKEEKERNRIVRKNKEFELKMLKAEKEQAKINAKKAMEREMERRRAAEARTDATHALIQAHAQQAEESRIVMEEREERVLLQLEEKKRSKATDVAEKRAAAARRIQNALEKNKKIQENKKKAYDAKQQEAAQRNMEKAAKEEDTLKKKMVTVEKLDQKRQQRLMENFQRCRERRVDIVTRRKEKEKFYMTVRKEREKLQAIRKLEHELAMEDKQQNIEHIKRIEQFVRLQTERKIMNETERSERIKQEREFMIEERKKATRQVTMQKFEIKDLMEKMKATNKFRNLDALLEPGAKGRRKKHSQSLPNLTAHASVGA